MERVMVFIDGNNLNNAVYHLFKGSPPRYDIGKLAEKLCGASRNLVKVYYYTALADREDNTRAYDGHRKFIDALRYAPRLEVVVGYLAKREIPGKEIKPGDPSTYIHIEKETDVNIATDLLIKAFFNSYDTAVLISADSDYARAVECVKFFGKTVELAVTKNQKAAKMKQLADVVIEMDQDFVLSCG
ncbi:MAG: NYN domain-containing protein [Peptococcaceae bacterium]|nr:NYN domain-containing protein [Peptococcaceae bacterium]